MYLRKDSHQIKIKLVSSIFLISLIKKMKRPGKVPVEELSKNKLFFELNGLREQHYERPTFSMFLTTPPVSALGAFFYPSVFSPESSHQSTSGEPSTGFPQEC